MFGLNKRELLGDFRIFSRHQAKEQLHNPFSQTSPSIARPDPLQSSASVQQSEISATPVISQPTLTTALWNNAVSYPSNVFKNEMTSLQLNKNQLRSENFYKILSMQEEIIKNCQQQIRQQSTFLLQNLDELLRQSQKMESDITNLLQSSGDCRVQTKAEDIRKESESNIKQPLKLQQLEEDVPKKLNHQVDHQILQVERYIESIQSEKKSEQYKTEKDKDSFQKIENFHTVKENQKSEEKLETNLSLQPERQQNSISDKMLNNQTNENQTSCHENNQADQIQTAQKKLNQNSTNLKKVQNAEQISDNKQMFQNNESIKLQPQSKYQAIPAKQFIGQKQQQFQQPKQQKFDLNHANQEQKFQNMLKNLETPPPSSTTQQNLQISFLEKRNETIKSNYRFSQKLSYQRDQFTDKDKRVKRKEKRKKQSLGLSSSSIERSQQPVEMKKKKRPSKKNDMDKQKRNKKIQVELQTSILLKIEQQDKNIVEKTEKANLEYWRQIFSNQSQMIRNSKDQLIKNTSHIDAVLEQLLQNIQQAKKHCPVPTQQNQFDPKDNSSLTSMSECVSNLKKNVETVKREIINEFQH